MEWFREIPARPHVEAMRIPIIASILNWVGIIIIASKMGCCREGDERSGIAPAVPAPVDYFIQPTNTQPF